MDAMTLPRRSFLAAAPVLAQAPLAAATNKLSPIRLGIGLNTDRINDDDLRFVRQLGVTHVVAHMPKVPGEGYWELDGLRELKRYIHSHGLALEALENFPIPHWHDVLLGRPGRDGQIANLQKTIRNMGKAGIPIMGYCFSLAGVWGHWRAYSAGGGRGGAGIKSFDYSRVKAAPQLPNGELWGVKFDPKATGTIGEVSQEEMWSRLRYFLERVMPVAEEAGVRLGAHPDDPPVPVLRGTGRLLVSHAAMRRFADLVPSKNHGFEFCQGTVAEMGGSVYDAIREFTGRKKIFYVHFRNVRGVFPTNFDETFIDEGAVDMLQCLRIYKEAGYEGILIPDHAPRVTAPGQWHAGIAFTLGYIRAAMQAAGV